MNYELHYAHRNPSEPFRWKLFLVILAVMGSLTIGAIVLTRLANPSRNTLTSPSSFDPTARLQIPLEHQTDRS
ncbi:MAG TPA: hypothetical protein VGC07_00340 [Granulicella sp.]